MFQKLVTALATWTGVIDQFSRVFYIFQDKNSNSRIIYAYENKIWKIIPHTNE